MFYHLTQKQFKMVTVIISLIISLLTGTDSTTSNQSTTADPQSTEQETITTFGGSSTWGND